MQSVEQAAPAPPAARTRAEAAPRTQGSPMTTRRPPRLESLASREPPVAFALACPDPQRRSHRFDGLGGQGRSQSDGQVADRRTVPTWPVHANLTGGGAR